MTNEELEKTLKSVRAYMSSLSGQLERRKKEIRSIEEKIDDTRQNLREWISTITNALSVKPSENIDKQSTETEVEEGWAGWRTVKKSLNPKEVSDAKSDFDRENLINHALYAFYMNLERGVCLSDAVEYLKRIEESGLYSGAMLSNAIDKADKKLFGGKLRRAMNGQIDESKKVDDSTEDIDRDIFGEYLGMP